MKHNQPFIPYQIVVMPRNRNMVSILLHEWFNNGYTSIHTNDDNTYFIMQHKEIQRMTANTKEELIEEGLKKEQYIVLSLPSHISKMQTLFNEYFNQGYRIVCLNDYSAVFEMVKK